MMSTFVFVTWNGGGNVTPALGIARALAEHRHTVAFLGEETQRGRIEAAGFAFTAFTRRPDWGGTPPQTPAERQRLLMRTIWMNESLADDLTAVLARSPADMVVVDCMLAGILANSSRFDVPTAVLVHSLFASVLDMRDALVTMGNRLRVEAGLPTLDAAAMKWEHKDLVLVTTLREFDGITDDPAPQVHYVPIRITSPRENRLSHEGSGMHYDCVRKPAKPTAQTRGTRLHDAADLVQEA